MQRRFASFATVKIGYARVSTADQNLDLQTDALKQAGCEKIFADHGVSGAKTERPGLDKALDQIRKAAIPNSRLRTLKNLDFPFSSDHGRA